MELEFRLFGFELLMTLGRRQETSESVTLGLSTELSEDNDTEDSEEAFGFSLPR